MRELFNYHFFGALKKLFELLLQQWLWFLYLVSRETQFEIKINIGNCFQNKQQLNH
jgi:hypothetical protein